MRYQVFSLQQSVLVDLGINLEESLLLDWFLNWKDGNGMKREYIEKVNDIGYWLNYETVIKELPILFKQPTDDMSEDDLRKLLRNNKDKVAKMLRGNLSKVLTAHKIVYKGNGAKLGSMIFVTVKRDMIDKLKNVENKEASPIAVEEAESNNELNTCTNIICDNEEKYTSELLENENIVESVEDKNKRLMEQERKFVPKYKL